MATTSVSQLAFGSVYNPVGASGGDGTQVPMPMGRGGDMLVSQAHAKYYQAAYRGNLFHARSPVAGSVIPIQTDTTASHYTFGVNNPAGSGVNMVMLQARVDISATSTFIAGEVYLDVVRIGELSIVLVATCTPITGGVQNALIGMGNRPKTTAFSALTLATSHADKQVVGLGSFDAVTTAADRQLERIFDGGLIIPPGVLLVVNGSAAQTSIAHVEFMYEEVPI